MLARARANVRFFFFMIGLDLQQVCHTFAEVIVNLMSGAKVLVAAIKNWHRYAVSSTLTTTKLYPRSDQKTGGQRVSVRAVGGSQLGVGELGCHLFPVAFTQRTADNLQIAVRKVWYFSHC